MQCGAFRGHGSFFVTARLRFGEYDMWYSCTQTFTLLTLCMWGECALVFLFLSSKWELVHFLNHLLSLSALCISPEPCHVGPQHSAVVFSSTGNFITEYWWCNCIPLLPRGYNDPDWRVCSKRQRWSCRNQESCWYGTLRRKLHWDGNSCFNGATCVYVYAESHRTWHQADTGRV